MYNDSTGVPEETTANRYRTKSPIFCNGISYLTVSNNAGLNVRLGFYSDSGFLYSVSAKNGASVQVPGEAIYFHFYTGALSIALVPTDLDYMLEIGQTASPHEPYGLSASLRFENCKGGYFSTEEEYTLKLHGPATAVAKVVCGNGVTLPTDLNEGDVWMPMLGKIVRADGSVESVDVQPIFAYPGTVTVTQEGEGLSATLSATMLVRR